MNELNQFLELNDISAEEIMHALHMDIREIILKTVCDKLKTDNDFFIRTKKLYFSMDDISATKKTVMHVCNCLMAPKDYIWINECLKAFFRKKDTRRIITADEKNELIRKQEGKCAICGTNITQAGMHVDHIIPWDYVGDELADNLQGLCSDCNLHKSNHVAIAVSNIIIHKERRGNEKNVSN